MMVKYHFGVADNNQVSFYLYDAAGERTVKFTGHNQWVDVNGVPQGYAGADKLTLYASPYMVASSGRYTKHYYAGEQRILSKIGGGGLGNYNAGIIAPETHRKKVAILENMVRFIGNTLYLKTLSVKPKPSVPCNQEGMLVDLCDYKNIVHQEEDRYFYHPDHLGSSSWITDRDGMPMQHLAYLPFGEEFVDQKTSNWSAAHKFSGKEKDEETGYNYFGARYFWSDGGIWLSIDPVSDKYPYISPYAYCDNKPIVYMDPDGREKLIFFDSKKEPSMIKSAQKYQDDGAIHIFAHGSSEGISVVVDGEIQTISNSKQLNKLLSTHSEVWQNKKEGDNVTIILHSCRAGEGDNSFAEKVSKDLGVTVIAPDQRVYVSSEGEVGAYKAKYTDKNNNYKRDSNGDVKSRERSDILGNWRVFEKEKETKSYKGNWKPKEKPSVWEKFWNQN